MDKVFGKHHHHNSEQGSIWVTGDGNSAIDDLGFVPTNASAGIDYSACPVTPTCCPPTPLKDSVNVAIHGRGLRFSWKVSGTVLVKWSASN